jgi:hypothetical protein
MNNPQADRYHSRRHPLVESKHDFRTSHEKNLRKYNR